MPRTPRIVEDGGIYHVLNRRVGRLPLFEDDGDYLAFEKVLEQVCLVIPMRILTYCLMPNHWHLVLWPLRGGDLSRFMQRLTLTHMRRWHAHHATAGTGALYQGRFKSFPAQQDQHALMMTRYVERNALRAKLVRRAEQWRWSGLWRRMHEPLPPWLFPADQWPIDVPRNWLTLVNTPQSDADEARIVRSIRRGAPLGSPAWQRLAAKRLGLQSTLRDPWRPKGNHPRK